LIAPIWVSFVTVPTVVIVASVTAPVIASITTPEPVG
jgi:hypothetical protein